MKYYILYFLFIVNFNRTNTDPQLNKSRSNIDIIIGRSWMLKDSMPEEAIKLINKGIQICEINNLNYEKSYLLNTRCLIYGNQGRFNEAIKDIIKVIQIRTAAKNYKEVINSYINYGMLLEKSGNKIQAQEVYLNAMHFSNSNIEFSVVTNLYNSLANLYFTMGHFTSALKYLHQSKTLYQKHNQADKLGYVFTNLGNVFKAQQNFDSASYYYNQAALNFEKTANKPELAALYSNLGALYTDHENYEDALNYYNKSLALYEKLAIPIGKAEVLTNLGVCYHDQKQYKKALTYLLRAEKLAGKTPNLLANIYYNISSAYEEDGDLRLALTYSQQYSDLKDTLFTSESNRLISEMRQKYEAEKSEREIKELKTEKALQQSKIIVRTQQRNIVLLSAGIVLILLTFAAFGYRQKLIKNKALSKQAEEQNKQEIEDLLKEQEIKAISAMIEGQEQERQRVAEDLHDRLGSLLSTVKLNFSGLERKMDTALQNSEQYKKSVSLLDEACGEVRKIAHNMASGVLQKYGFLTSVEELKKSIENSGKISMNIYTHNSHLPLDKETEINLYRITQELISNILRHSGATVVNLHFNIVDENINLIIEDNGRGFNTKNNSSGMGLRNVQVRVSKLYGTLNIDSSVGRGTTSIINIPLKEHNFLRT